MKQKTNFEFYTENEEMMAQALANAFFAGVKWAGKEYTVEQYAEIVGQYFDLMYQSVGCYAGVCG